MQSVIVDNVELILSSPLETDSEWIGQIELQRQLEACWLSLHEADYPLTPRIIGHPGLGKTTLAIATAKKRRQQIYIMQCTADTRPEDLLVTPVLSTKGTISYHASPLLSAVLKGGIAILDEGNRMSEKSWASLASLFDTRRMVESIIAGITIKAHPEFRAAVTMNEDESTYEIPDYIISRLQPQIEIGFPSKEDEMKILSYNIPFCDEEILELCVNFLQSAHSFDLPYSIRDGINAIRYTLKLKRMNPQSHSPDLFHAAVQQILGRDAFDMKSNQNASKNLHSLNAESEFTDMSLGNFFFPDTDSLNPDSPQELKP